MPETLASQRLQGAAQLVVLPLDDGRTECAVGPFRVPCDRHRRRHVEDDGGGQDIVLLRHRDEAPAGVRLHVRRVNDGQQAPRQALADDEAQ